MKRYISFFILLGTIQLLFAQNLVKMSAVKSNDYGVSYSLPKTEIVIRATYTKTTRKAGEFYRFAERYLNVSNPITQDEVVFSLNNLEATTTGVVDKNQSYLVEFKSGSIAPFVMLTKDGLICSINEEVSLPSVKLFPDLPEQEKSKIVNPKSFLSEEILRAGSTAKQAELIAKQIYRLRESKTNILTGDADNMPPDGNAYKLIMTQIDEQEKALTSMFTGSEDVEVYTKEFNFIPDANNIDKRTIFRFSTKLGIVEANDLAGAPVSLTLTNKEPKNETPLTEKEQKAWNDKFSKGIIYNIPAKANMRIDFDGRNMLQKECDVVQYGTLEVLVPKQLEYKKDNPVRIVFYHELGAIKQIY